MPWWERLPQEWMDIAIRRISFSFSISLSEEEACKVESSSCPGVVEVVDEE